MPGGPGKADQGVSAGEGGKEQGRPQGDGRQWKGELALAGVQSWPWGAADRTQGEGAGGGARTSGWLEVIAGGTAIPANSTVWGRPPSAWPTRGGGHDLQEKRSKNGEGDGMQDCCVSCSVTEKDGRRDSDSDDESGTKLAKG